MIPKFLPLGIMVVFLLSGQIPAVEEDESASNLRPSSLERVISDLASRLFGKESGAVPEATDCPQDAILGYDCAVDGKYDAAIAYFRAAERTQPELPDAPRHEVSAADLKHGEKQVRRLFQDRADLQEFIDGDVEILEWLTRRFAGEGLGEHISWDSRPPRCGAAAENSGHWNEPGRTIRLATVYARGRRGRPIEPEAVLNLLVFELHNLENSEDFGRLEMERKQGKISEKDWMFRLFCLEYAAARSTRRFYVNVFLPFAQRKQLQTEPGFWLAAYGEPADALNTLIRFSGNPYEWLLELQRVKDLYYAGDFEEAVSFAEKALRKDEWKYRSHVLLRWITWCQMKQQKYDAAILSAWKALAASPGGTYDTEYQALLRNAEEAHLLRNAEEAKTDAEAADPGVTSDNPLGERDSAEPPSESGPARGIFNALKRGVEQTYHSGH